MINKHRKPDLPLKSLRLIDFSPCRTGYQLKDEVFDIRWLAAEALIAIGAESVKPLLAALVDEPKELFLRQGAHHVIKDIIHQNPKETELNEILKSVESALDSIIPSITVSGAAKVALKKLKTLYHY